MYVWYVYLSFSLLEMFVVSQHIFKNFEFVFCLVL